MPVCPSTQRSRRWRQRIALGDAAPAEAALVVRKARGAKPKKPRGRPRFLLDELTAEGLRNRLYRDAVQMKRTTVPFDALVAVGAAAVEAEAEAERQRAENVRKAMRKLDARNASDGQVADGPKALRLTAAAAVANCDEHGESALPVCAVCLCDETECESDVGPCPTRCCGNWVCPGCLEVWLGCNGDEVEVGYEDGVQGVEHVRRDRKIMVIMNTHTCPMCRESVERVGRSLVMNA